MLQEVNLVSTIVRILLSMLLGGILGIDRERKKRPAGFRTYMVVCIGSTLAMLTNQYVFQNIGSSDPTRIAGQVISGIGFLGAGTIIVTGHNQVKGLTTAAGLWAAASLGLAIGIGFYEGAIVACSALFIVMNSLQFMDSYLSSKSKDIRLYIEFSEIKDLSKFLTTVRNMGTSVLDIEMNKANGIAVSAMMTIKMSQKREHAEVIEIFGAIEGVNYIEELN